VQEYLVDGLFHVVGAMFINALKMLVVPLVTFSLICGVCGIGDVSTLGRVGIRAFLLFLLTTALAITLAITVAVVVGPGEGFELQGGTMEFTAPEAPPLTQVIIDLVPTNPVAAYAEGNMLQIIFFTILFSICILMIGERGRSIYEGADKLNDVMMELVNLVMHVAPIGVFALMAKTFAQQGLGMILPMISYFGVVALVLLLHMTGTLMLLLKFLGRSSNATIPVTLRAVEKRLGVDNSTASFVVPFGATINMDGTAIMQGVATVFIANVYGVDLGITGYVTVIGLIMGVDRILDMMRTAVNVTGDAVITTVVARAEDKIDIEAFNDPAAGHLEEVHLPHEAPMPEREHG